MPLYQVIVLATAQGLTEFLPISSTAHLTLIPWLFHWTDPGLAFDVALHIGTLVAVLIYFFKTWVDLLVVGFGGQPIFVEKGIPSDIAANRLLLWFLVLGTIPAGVAGWMFHEQVETTWRQPIIIAVAMIGVALIMAWGEKIGSQKKGLSEVSLFDSICVGIAQAFALIPGVSRSGITITGGLFRGMKRETSARFSFLLSTPIIAGAALKETLGFAKNGVPQEMHLPLIVGISVSAIVGYATIAFFIKYLQVNTFKIFVYYRIVFGIIILALVYFFGLKTSV